MVVPYYKDDMMMMMTCLAYNYSFINYALFGLLMVQIVEMESVKNDVQSFLLVCKFWAWCYVTSNKNIPFWLFGESLFFIARKREWNKNRICFFYEWWHKWHTDCKMRVDCLIGRAVMLLCVLRWCKLVLKQMMIWIVGNITAIKDSSK